MNRLWTAVWAGLLMLLLSGCIFRTPDELYQLPARTPGHEELTRSIEEVRRELDAQYGTTVETAVIYSGDNTSNIQLQDLDGDGEKETAVTFFRVSGAERPLRIYFFTLQADGSYQVTSIIEGAGSAIYGVDYADLRGDGKKEVVVRWQTGTNVYQLGVYSLDSAQEGETVAPGRPGATELMMTAYSGYSLLDIDQDTRNELAVIRVDPQGANDLVEIYGWSGGAFLLLGSTRLSAGITAINRVRANFVSDSVRALYVTGTLLDGSRATDIIVWRGGAPVNLTLNPETGISVETLRGYGSVGPLDVNDDMILEMPRPNLLPSYTGGASSDYWLVNWLQYDVNGSARKVTTTYHNTMDNWYLEIPEEWIGEITIGRDDSVTGERAVVFYFWNGAEEEPTPFLAVYQLSGVNRGIRASQGDRFVLSEDDSTIYAASFLDSKRDCGLEEMDVLARFHRILSGWAGE